MKPSKIKTIKAKKAWFLLTGFAALTWMGTVYCKRKEDIISLNKTTNIDSRLKSHETIHVRQAESMKDSWFFFYIRYVWEWIKNFPLIFININAPYMFMPIEMEAYLKQDNWKYATKGAVTKWKELEKLTLKEKRNMAKEYYKSKPYFTHFLNIKLKAKNGTI